MTEITIEKTLHVHNCSHDNDGVIFYFIGSSGIRENTPINKWHVGTFTSGKWRIKVECAEHIGMTQAQAIECCKKHIEVCELQALVWK